MFYKLGLVSILLPTVFASSAAAGAAITFTFDPTKRGLDYTCFNLPCHSGYPSTYGGCAVVNNTDIIWCCPAKQYHHPPFFFPILSVPK